MARKNHVLADENKLPSALRSRQGWSNLFDGQRNRYPHLHQIEPTNHCPYTCIMCPRPGRMKRKLGFMERALFEKIIGEVSEYPEEVREKEIELFHFGESLLHPRITELVRIASDRGLKTVLSVNAPHLTPRLSEKLLAARPYKIIVSLDGGDPESYQKVRGKAANFEKAIRNIQALADAHQDSQSSTMLYLRMIELNENRNQRNRFEQMFQHPNLTVEFRPFFPWTEPDMADQGEFEAYPAHMPCRFPWDYLVVQWDGSVVPCCRDYDGVNIMGNAKTASLYEIWNSPRYELFRAQHRTGVYTENRLCDQCMSLYYTPGSNDRS